MMVWWKLVQLQTSAGKLRRLLKECEKLCETAGAKTPSSELALRAASSNNQVLGIDLGPKLSAVTLAKLWDDFSKHYPAEVLCGDVRPCRALVQSIYVQKSHNELKFIPWKHITSEVQADREKQTSQKKEKKLLDILALAAGQVDLPECELPSGSPYVVQKLGLRGPTIQEAETADAKVCRQLAFDDQWVFFGSSNS